MMPVPVPVAELGVVGSEPVNVPAGPSTSWIVSASAPGVVPLVTVTVSGPVPARSASVSVTTMSSPGRPAERTSVPSVPPATGAVFEAVAGLPLKSAASA